MRWYCRGSFARWFTVRGAQTSHTKECGANRAATRRSGLRSFQNEKMKKKFCRNFFPHLAFFQHRKIVRSTTQCNAAIVARQDSSTVETKHVAYAEQQEEHARYTETLQMSLPISEILASYFYKKKRERHIENTSLSSEHSAWCSTEERDVKRMLE